MTTSRRQDYRIVYPVIERPTFEVTRALMEVVDLSERGIRYEIGTRRPPIVGDEIRGRIIFRRGDEIEVKGSVIRADEGIIVLALKPPLPYSQIMAEQRYLRSKGYSLKD
jgi:hypothetical protein